MLQKFLLFNNNYDAQTYGLIIGCTLSPFLDDVFMDYFENNRKLNKCNRRSSRINEQLSKTPLPKVQYLQLHTELKFRKII